MVFLSQFISARLLLDKAQFLCLLVYIHIRIHSPGTTVSIPPRSVPQLPLCHLLSYFCSLCPQWASH